MSETESKTYRAVRVEKGGRGWGGPLTIHPKPGREYVVSITGGGIHPVAQKIAEMTGGIPFDGFKSKVGFEQMACCVIDCGGTARVGVYPMKKVPTIDVHPTMPAGPLMMFITEDVFVSGVKEENIKPVE
jgi:sorbitol-specific phosphotransferase system component IIBC